MKLAYGLEVPTELKDVCRPSRCALIIYDMQVGVVAQIKAQEIVEHCRELHDAALEAGFRVFFTRHVFLPSRLAGVGQLRRAMIWQKESDPGSTQPLFTQGSPKWEIVPELAPRPGEVVVDKLTMSAFESTFLNLALRDAKIDSFIIAGIALEIGIEPTLRHALDLNYCPVLVTDACGSANAELRQRSLATLDATGEILAATTADVITTMRNTIASGE